eukprot:scaffold72560_cov59-Attheya_sp.AAC.1
MKKASSSGTLLSLNGDYTIFDSNSTSLLLPYEGLWLDGWGLAEQGDQKDDCMHFLSAFFEQRLLFYYFLMHALSSWNQSKRIRKQKRCCLGIDIPF